jgi:hypothetical protein
MSAGEVDDRKPAHADRARPVDVTALVVRPAVHGDAAHAPQHARVGRPAVELEHPVYTAHGSLVLYAVATTRSSGRRRGAERMRL